MTAAQILALLRQRAGRDDPAEEPMDPNILLPIGIVLAQQRLAAGDEIVVWRHEKANRLGVLHKLGTRLVKGRPGVSFTVYSGLTTRDLGMSSSTTYAFSLNEMDEDCNLIELKPGKWKLVLCPPEGT